VLHRWRAGGTPFSSIPRACRPCPKLRTCFFCQTRFGLAIISDVRELHMWRKQHAHGIGWLARVQLGTECTHKYLGFEARLLLHRCDFSPVSSLQACVAPGRDGRELKQVSANDLVQLTRVARSRFCGQHGERAADQLQSHVGTHCRTFPRFWPVARCSCKEVTRTCAQDRFVAHACGQHSGDHNTTSHCTRGYAAEGRRAYV
jgi:hypothetical protein